MKAKNTNKKKILLLRDDDINFFTSPDQLLEVYGFLFSYNIPINFSVIPAINPSATTESIDFGKESYEPFIPKQTAGIDKEFPLSDNSEIKSFFSSFYGKYDILLHGFNHKSIDGNYEFDSQDKKKVFQKITNGLEIIDSVFHTHPKTFVAPQDQYSKVTLECLEKQFNFFSLGWIDRKKLPLLSLPAYLLMKLRKRNFLNIGKLVLTEHPGCIFSQFRKTTHEISKLDAYIEKYDFTVIVVHHWEFYKENGKLDLPRYHLFQDKIQELHQQHRFIFFKDFSSLYDFC